MLSNYNKPSSRLRAKTAVK